MKKFLDIIIIFICSFVILNKINAYTEYKVGDDLTYNSIKFYVIKDSGKDDATVTLLKAEPLTTDEVNNYGGVGTNNNHVNKYTYGSIGKAYNSNGYGGMAYYTSKNCGYIWHSNANGDYSMTDTECTNNYDKSDVKYVVDAWVNENISADLLKKDFTGYSARLITLDELLDNLGYEVKNVCTHICYNNGTLANVPKWIYSNSIFSYWTMSPNNDVDSVNWVVGMGGELNGSNIDNTELVRPVIILRKTAFGDVEEQVIVDNNEKNDEANTTIKNEDQNKIEDIVNVVVPNTMQVMSLIFIVIGIVLIIIAAVLIIIKKLNKNR